MIIFKLQALDRRHSGNHIYGYRAERLHQRNPIEGRASMKCFAEARAYLWQAFGWSADLDEMFAVYGNDDKPVWCWRTNHLSGHYIYLKSPKEISVFLLKYAEQTQVDPKIKF